MFHELKANDATAAVPVVELFRHNWLAVLRVSVTATFTMVNTIVNVFALAYATKVVGLSTATMLAVIAAANAAAVFTQPVFDAIAGANVPLIYVSGIVLLGVCYAAPNGIYPSYFPEQFPAKVRYSGMAISLMVGLLAAGFTPALAQALTEGNPADWTPAAWLCAGFVVVVAAAAALTGPETYRTPTDELGLRPAKAASQVRVGSPS